MTSLKPALAGILFISGAVAAYADQPMPNGTVSPLTHQQTNGYPTHLNPPRARHMRYGWNAMYQAAPNGTVSSLTRQQTNGYPGHLNPPRSHRVAYGWNSMRQPQPNGKISPITGKQTNGY